MKKLFAAVVMVVVVTVGAVSLFGDNVRRLFAMNADSLAGNDPPPHALTRKKMLNFGTTGGGYDDGAIAPAPSGNSHLAVVPNQMTDTRKDHLSTFAIDVDTASYTLARRTLRGGALPVEAGVRIEEWINAFSYELDEPKGQPFSVAVEGAPSPFNEGRTLLKVSIQGRHVVNVDRKPAHLVFLVDTSCSMSGPDCLGLAQESLRILTRNLNARDTVALVTYSGDVRDVLPPTSAESRQTILDAIDSLSTAGGTAMGSGLELAYRHAAKRVAPGHVSRVLVLTDGDANVGTIGSQGMLEAVQGYVKEGVTLTTVGFGMGNYRDSTLEQLADKGNGQSVYIDSREEAVKVFETKLAGTLEVIARDVKVQVDFDPAVVSEYRLLGYENREVRDEDFRDDRVDGGEIGAGHSVTALYELKAKPGAALGTVFVRGKRPEGAAAFEVTTPMPASVVRSSVASASTELRFAIAVAVAADILRGNPAAADWTLAKARALAEEAAGGSAERREFVALLELAEALPPQGLAAARPAVPDTY